MKVYTESADNLKMKNNRKAITQSLYYDLIKVQRSPGNSLQDLDRGASNALGQFPLGLENQNKAVVFGQNAVKGNSYNSRDHYRWNKTQTSNDINGRWDIVLISDEKRNPGSFQNEKIIDFERAPKDPAHPHRFENLKDSCELYNAENSYNDLKVKACRSYRLNPEFKMNLKDSYTLNYEDPKAITRNVDKQPSDRKGNPRTSSEENRPEYRRNNAYRFRDEYPEANLKDSIILTKDRAIRNEYNGFSKHNKDLHSIDYCNDYPQIVYEYISPDNDINPHYSPYSNHADCSEIENKSKTLQVKDSIGNNRHHHHSVQNDNQRNLKSAYDRSQSNSNVKYSYRDKTANDPRDAVQYNSNEYNSVPRLQKPTHISTPAIYNSDVHGSPKKHGSRSKSVHCRYAKPKRSAMKKNSKRNNKKVSFAEHQNMRYEVSRWVSDVDLNDNSPVKTIYDGSIEKSYPNVDTVVERKPLTEFSLNASSPVQRSAPVLAPVKVQPALNTTYTNIQQNYSFYDWQPRIGSYEPLYRNKYSIY